jgi:diketogulonate reductase-like aldo/keto reductase
MFGNLNSAQDNLSAGARELDTAQLSADYQVYKLIKKSQKPHEHLFVENCLAEW